MNTGFSMLAWSALLLAAGCASGAHLTDFAGPPPATFAYTPAEVAEQAAPVERPARITVEEAVAEALEGNRIVAQARLGAAIGRNREHEARAALLPSLTGNASFQRRDEPPQAVAPELGATFTVGPRDVGIVGLTLSFPVFAFGRYFHGYKAARSSRFQAEADRQATEADIAAAVTAAAFDLLETIRLVDVARSNEEALERQVQDAQALFDAGRVTKSAKLEAEVEYENARRLRERAESIIPIRRMLLNQLLGRPVDAPTEVVDAPMTQAPDFDLEALQEEALSRRPELRSAQFELEAAARNLKSVIGGEFGEIRGVGTYSANNSPFGVPADSASILLTWDLPLYTGGARGARIRRARHELEVVRLRKDELDAEILTEVASAHRDVMEAFKDIAVAQRSIENAKESLRIQREKFATGRATSREVLESTALLTDSMVRHVQAVYSYNVALRELHRARGADPRGSPLLPRIGEE